MNDRIPACPGCEEDHPAHDVPLRPFQMADQLGDQIEKLTESQQNQLLWRLVYGHTDAVKAALAEMERRGWQL